MTRPVILLVVSNANVNNDLPVFVLLTGFLVGRDSKLNRIGPV